MTNPSLPRADHVEVRIQHLIARLERLHERAVWCSERFTRWRIAIFTVGTIAVSAAAFWDPARGGWIPLGLFGAAFAVVARMHIRHKRRLRRLEAWLAIKRTHRARIRLDWAGLPDARHHAPEGHPYAVDLDMVGPRSVLRWLDTTTTTTGKNKLTRWLLDPDRDGFAERHNLIREAQSLRLFRDRVILEAGLASDTALNGERVTAAVERSAPPRLTSILVVEFGLVALTAALLVASWLGGLPGYWVLPLIAYVGVFWWAAPRLATVFAQAVDLQTDLAPFGRLFAAFERRSFHRHPALSSLLAPFQDHVAKPSVATRRLASLVAALNVRAHPLAHLAVNLVVPWDLWFAERFRLLRDEIAGRLPGWIDVVGRFEAASALGHYADTHPDFVYPTLWLPPLSTEQVAIKVVDVGHPLLPPATRVRNDFTLQGLGATAIITGSNMSGKSTFLRTLGVNLTLAEAGAPVCATQWRSAWMRVVCCIRVEDSLDGGISYFYAEVKRLKRLLDAASDTQAPPVFFLIDEIFRGTNNRERLIGSRHFVRALGDANCLGLVSTHDLELAKLEEESKRIRTDHFRETVDAHGLAFDYHIRPGPCPTTNALKIMAREGLPVPKDGDEPQK